MAVGKLELKTTTIAGIETTRFGLGCWAFGGSGWGGQEDDESIATIKTALEAGVNHFDTATAYGDGKSEQVVGRALKDAGRQVFVASKRDFVPTAEEMIKAVDESRDRLGCDRIDLYYLHWPKAGADLRPPIEGLERCRADGKIRAIGVSNVTVEQMEEMAQAGTIDAHQFCYNLFWRFAEKDVVAYLKENHITGVTYSSIAQGILTGKFDRHPKFPEGDQRNSNVLFDEQVYPHLYEATEEMKKVAEEAGRPLVDLAIRWVLEQPGVDVALIGARRPDQLEANLKATQMDVDKTVLDKLTAISSEAIKYLPQDEGNIFRHHP